MGRLSSPQELEKYRSEILGKQPFEGRQQVEYAVQHDARYFDRRRLSLWSVPRGPRSGTPADRDSLAR